MTTPQSAAPEALTALVIDDEAALRGVLVRILESAGCRVLPAASGEDGLRLIERGEPSVDVVLTDFNMPGLTGLDVLEVLAEHRSELPVAIVSGHTGAIYQVKRRGTGTFRVLEKPFSPEAVLALARELFAESRRTRGTAETQRTRARAARERSQNLIEKNSTVRYRTDLVSAAWAIHHSRGHPR